VALRRKVPFPIIDAAAPSPVRRIVPNPSQFPPTRPLVFAHRGGRALGPENTLVAFDLGVAAGADGLELDVHLARDGRVVVIHDPTLDRSTRATGPVADRTAAELAAVEATPRFGINLEAAWTGPRAGVPTLDEVLARYRNVALIIEMKGERPELGPAVVAAVRAAGAETWVCLGSFSSQILDAARRAAPELATGASAAEGLRALKRSWFGLSPGRGLPYRAFQVPLTSGRMRVVSRRFVRAVHRAGCAVQVWTVNDPAEMRRLLDWGVDGLITDRPAVAVTVRDRWLENRRRQPR
jgi:glycerophosphoryl diester phosphodiesterase